jgi:holo-[acyl-carrier protein] synthase
VAALLARYGERAETRVFTEGEVSYSRARANPTQHLAARFAAKEAAMKALGRGMGQGASLHEIEVVSDGVSRPVLRISGATADIALGLGVRTIHLSLSHTDDHGIAVVVLEG